VKSEMQAMRDKFLTDKQQSFRKKFLADKKRKSIRSSESGL